MFRNKLIIKNIKCLYCFLDNVVIVVLSWKPKKQATVNMHCCVSKEYTYIQYLHIHTDTYILKKSSSINLKKAKNVFRGIFNLGKYVEVQIGETNF